MKIGDRVSTVIHIGNPWAVDADIEAGSTGTIIGSDPWNIFSFLVRFDDCGEEVYMHEHELETLE